MPRCSRLRLASLTVMLGTLFQPALADITLTDTLSAYGDSRIGYFNQHRHERDRSSATNDEFRLRLRGGLKWRPDDHWTVAARLAGRYTTAQSSTHFIVDRYTTTTDGMAFGESTVDEFYVDYRYAQGALRAGRFQMKHELMGVGKKSLDSNDSSNTEITWTDGLLWTRAFDNGWQTKLLLEHNDRKGPSNTKRAPLHFLDSDARWSAFTALENEQAWGPVVQRVISLNWLPDALYHRGLDAGSNEDYLALVARTSLQWPVGNDGSSFMLGLEGGYAPNTPSKQSLGLPGNGDTRGTAFQIKLNWLDFAPGHGIAFIAARAEAGWLLSPDFRPNNDLYEVRYQFKPAPQHTFEARLRQRSDIDKPLGAQRERKDVDFYLRYTLKF